jgi:hypothetical protein
VLLRPGVFCVCELLCTVHICNECACLYCFRNLSSNRISAIEKGGLDNLPLLEELRLNRNLLTKFNKTVFRGLKHLRIL